MTMNSETTLGDDHRSKLSCSPKVASTRYLVTVKA